MEKSARPMAEGNEASVSEITEGRREIRTLPGGQEG